MQTLSKVSADKERRALFLWSSTNPGALQLRRYWRITEGYSYVIFVMSGEHQLLDVNKPNTKKLTVNDELLVFCYQPRETAIENDENDERKRWFQKRSHGWVVNMHESPCLGCGSPWCLYKKYKQFVQNMFLRIGRYTRSNNRSKRHCCYVELMAEEYGRMR